MKFELVVITLVLLQLADAGDIKRLHKKRHIHKRTGSAESCEFQRCIKNSDVARYFENQKQDCEPCEVCEQPPNIENASPIPNLQFPPGYLMAYDCAPGSYQNSSMVCLKNGRWNTSAVSCQFVKTCDEAASIGVTIGSTLTVKPIATMNPVSVRCEHSDTGGYWTVIDTTWDNSSKIQGHEAARSGVYNVGYSLSLDYIGAIADASTNCTQYVKAICTNSDLMDYNGWKMRNGELADYFFGGVKGQMNCACNLDNSCYRGRKCNCGDYYETREDEGWSTYKEDLPITAFLNGDTDYYTEYYYLNIGSLRCRGVETE